MMISCLWDYLISISAIIILKFKDIHCTAIPISMTTNMQNTSTMMVSTTTPIVTSSGIPVTTTTAEIPLVSKEMITGLAAGIGFFVGTIACCCLIWCICCGNLCKEKNTRKVSPLEPRFTSRTR